LPPASHTNAWILGEDNVVVVDPASPWPDEQDALISALDGLNVSAIFLTHHHHDHIAGASQLRREKNAPILAHPHTCEHVPFAVDTKVDEGFTIDTESESWRAIHTPGHARGHLCLISDSHDVIAGDMIAGVGTIVLDPPEGNLGDYLCSLQRLIDLDPRTLFPAHGPDLTDPQTTLTHYIKHRRMRTDQILEALKQRKQPSQPHDLVYSVYGTSISNAIMPVAARQVLCHLHWLVEHGQVKHHINGFELISKSSATLTGAQ